MPVSSRFLGVLAVLLIGGSLLPAAATARPGDLIPEFGADGLAVTAPGPGGREAPADLARLADGSLLVAGSAASGSGSLLIKYRPDGSIDGTFGDDGKVRGAGPGWQRLDLLPDGRIMLGGGKGTQLVFQRLNPDGSPDLAFGSDGQVTLDTGGLSYLSESLPPDAGLSSLKVLAGGETRAFGGFAGCGGLPGSCGSVLAVGLEENGDPSPGFGSSGAKDIAVHGDAIVSTVFDDGRSLVVRSENYGADGGRTFAFPVTASGDPGQEITVTGSYNYSPALEPYAGDAGDPDRALLTSGDSVWRLLADGHPDPAFGSEGEVDIRDLTRFVPGEARFSPTDVVTDSEHRILISGGLISGRDRIGRGDASASSGAVARLSADGRIDSSFGGGGLNLLWPGRRAGQDLEGRTAIIAADGSATLVGMGPATGSYGFTLARIGNGEMEMPSCKGRPADYMGTPGPDRVEAHQASIVTGAGDDVVSGSGYRSKICTGAGQDVVRLSQGPARIFAGPGRDRIHLGGTDLTDRLWVYLAYGGPGNDRIIGSMRSDLLGGDRGNDLVLGRGGDDRLQGGSSVDRLFGQAGHDQLIGGPGADVLRAGPIGPDRTDYVSRRRDRLLVRFITQGRKGEAFVRLPYVCRGGGKHRSDLTLSDLPFDPSTGSLKRVTGRRGDSLIADVDAKVKGGRIAGRLRIVDDYEFDDDFPCRTGKGPFRYKTMLRDAWVRFSIKARPQRRQFARQ